MMNINKKTFFLFLCGIALLIPATAFVGAGFAPGDPPFAQQDVTFEGEIAKSTANEVINGVLNLIWILLVIFAIIMFIVAGFQFLAARGEPEGIKKAQQSILWGVVGLVVAIVAFSVPRILVTWFGGG